MVCFSPMEFDVWLAFRALALRRSRVYSFRVLIGPSSEQMFVCVCLSVCLPVCLQARIYVCVYLVCMYVKLLYNCENNKLKFQEVIKDRQLLVSKL